MTLTGHYENRLECDNAQTFTYLECDWTMTATFVRVGTDCASYRYEATTCDLSYQYRKWTVVSAGGNHDGFCCEGWPPNTCIPAWACDANCNCITPDIRPLTYDEANISTTFTGKSTGYVTPYGITTAANKVLTIACIPDPCLPGCVAPIMIFNPDGTFGPESCYGVQVNAAHHRDCYYPASYPECGGTYCGAGPNYLNDILVFYFNPWIIKGASGCLSNSSFDDPYALNSCPSAAPTSLSIWKYSTDEWGVDWFPSDCYRLNQTRTAGTYYEYGYCSKDAPLCDPSRPDTICKWEIFCNPVYQEQWGWSWV